MVHSFSNPGMCVAQGIFVSNKITPIITCLMNLNGGSFAVRLQGCGSICACSYYLQLHRQQPSSKSRLCRSPILSTHPCSITRLPNPKQWFASCHLTRMAKALAQLEATSQHRPLGQSLGHRNPHLHHRLARGEGMARQPDLQIADGELQVHYRCALQFVVLLRATCRAQQQ